MTELRNSGKEVIITGCMAKVQMNRINIRLPGSLVIAPEEYPEFSSIVSDRYGSSITINADIGSNIIPIAGGCLGDCTYCITKFARGALKSQPTDDLVERFNRIVDSGIKEILVTAQDTGCYGFDIGTSLPKLIEKMLESEKDFRLRIGMMNPNNLMHIIDDLMDVMKDPRVYRFLHIPVQSGSDDILRTMNRQYTVNEFMTLIEKIRSIHPDVSISTDLISGFPGETEKDHKKNIELIKMLRADTINITRFSPRPGTEAASMEQVHGRVMKERSAELTDMKNRTEHDINTSLIGKRLNALVTEHGKKGTVIARTDNYRPVAIVSDMPIGSFVNVEITDCAPTYLIGRI
jgi:MiaB-like tRNA modifying enzyme, archaeal-type